MSAFVLDFVIPVARWLPFSKTAAAMVQHLQDMYAAARDELSCASLAEQNDCERCQTEGSSQEMDQTLSVVDSITGLTGATAGDSEACPVDNTSLLGMAPGSPPASVAPDSSSDSATQSELMQLAVVASCDQSAPPCDRTACDLADALAAAAESLFQSSQRLSDAVPVLRSIRLPDSGAVRAAGLGALESSAEVSRNTAHLLSLVKSITSHESTQHAGRAVRSPVNSRQSASASWTEHLPHSPSDLAEQSATSQVCDTSTTQHSPWVRHLRGAINPAASTNRDAATVNTCAAIPNKHQAVGSTFEQQREIGASGLLASSQLQPGPCSQSADDVTGCEPEESDSRCASSSLSSNSSSNSTNAELPAAVQVHDGDYQHCLCHPQLSLELDQEIVLSEQQAGPQLQTATCSAPASSINTNTASAGDTASPGNSSSAAATGKLANMGTEQKSDGSPSDDGVNMPVGCQCHPAVSSQPISLQEDVLHTAQDQALPCSSKATSPQCDHDSDGCLPGTTSCCAVAHAARNISMCGLLALQAGSTISLAEFSGLGSQTLRAYEPAQTITGGPQHQAAVSPPLPPEGHQLHDGTQATELEQLQNTAFGPTLAHQALQANINAAGSPAAAEHGTVPLPCCPEAGHSGAKDVLHGSAPGATSIQGPVAAAIDAWALRQLRHKHYGGPLLTDRKPGTSHLLKSIKNDASSSVPLPLCAECRAAGVTILTSPDGHLRIKGRRLIRRCSVKTCSAFAHVLPSALQPGSRLITLHGALRRLQPSSKQRAHMGSGIPAAIPLEAYNSVMTSI